MPPCLDATTIIVSPGFFHSPINDGPRNRLQNVMKNDSLGTHGFDPFSVQMIRNQLKSSRINAVRFFKHRTCRTLVGLSRPSTSSLLKLRNKDVDAREARA
jgi:hypothetical protein